MKEDKEQKDNQVDISKISADFQCFVCGAIFTTNEDRKQHLEKEAHGLLVSAVVLYMTWESPKFL